MAILTTLKAAKVKIIAVIGIALITALLLSLYLYSEEKDKTTKLTVEVGQLKQDVLELETSLAIEKANVKVKEVVVEKLVEKEGKTIYITETITVEVEKDVQTIIDTTSPEDVIPAVTNSVVDSMWKQYCLSETDNGACPASGADK